MAAIEYRHIRGFVLEEPTPTPLAGVVVEMVEAEEGRVVKRGKVLAFGRTSSDGQFSLSVTERALSASGSRVRFVVKTREGDGYTFAEHSEDTFDLDLVTSDIALCVEPFSSCEVPDGIAEPTPGVDERIIYGQVRHRDGAPAEGAEVEAVRVTVSGGPAGLTPKASVDGDGKYSITVTDDSDPWHLFIKVVNTSSMEAIGASEVVTNADLVQRIDLLVEDEHYRGRSKYEDLKNAVDGEAEGEDYAALSAEKVALIAETKAEEPRDAARFVAAVRTSLKLGLTTFIDGQADPAPDPIPADRAEQVYGLVAMGWPPSPQGLASGDFARIEDDLSRAADGNFITRAAADDYSDFVDELKDAAVDYALDSETPGSLGSLLNVTGLALGKQETFLGLWRDRTTDIPTFWSDLKLGASGLTTEEAEKVEKVVKLGVFSFNFAPMVSAIATELGTADVEDVAKWTASDWTERTDTAGAPDWFPGADAAERKTNFAKALLDATERAYPGVRFRDRVIGTSVGAVSAATKTWLTNNDVDLSTTHFSYDESSPDSTMKELRILQRLYRVGPDTGRAETMLALMDEGYDSAKSIVAGGRTRFLEATDGIIDEDLAKQIFTRSEAAHRAALLLALQKHRKTAGSSAAALDDAPDNPAASGPLSDIEEIFGRFGSCQCSFCRSITGPGAYFVHLMDWIKDRGGLTFSAGTPPVWKLLDGRRPDLGRMLISCKNAETILPYIDLSIELLGDIITGSDSSRTESNWSQEELQVTPEYPNLDAYQELSESSYPAVVPYHYYEDVQRVFLDHLGVPRRALWANWEGAIGSSAPTDAEIGRERIEMAAAQYTLVGTKGTWQDYWSADGSVTAADLQPADEFLRRAKITFEELRELLRLRASGAVNPSDASQNLLVTVDSADDPCVLSNWTIETAGATTPSGDQFRGLSRFIRLWRHVPWTMLELDVVLSSLGGLQVLDNLNSVSGALGQVGDALEVERQLGVPAVELVALWSDLDLYQGFDGAEDDDAFVARYDRRFLDPKVHPEARDDSFPLALNQDRNGLAHSPTRDELVEILGGALGVKSADVIAAFDWMEDAGFDVAPVSLASVNAVSRRILFAKWVGWSVQDLRHYWVASGRDSASAIPGSFASPYGVLQLLGEIRLLERAGLSGATWGYLLEHDSDSVDAAGPSTDRLADWVGSVRQAVRQSLSGAEEQSLSYGQLRTTVSNALAAAIGLPEEVVADLMDRSDGLPAGGFASIFLNPSFVPGAGVPSSGDPLDDLDPDHLRDTSAFEAVELLHKFAILHEAVEPNLAEVKAWLDSAYGEFTVLPDPFTLPVGQPGVDSSSGSRNTAYLNLLRFFSLRRFLPESTSLVRLIEGPLEVPFDEAEDENYSSILASLGGWAQDDVAAVLDSFRVGLSTDLNAELAPAYIEGTLQALRWADDIGTSGARVASWVDPTAWDGSDFAASAEIAQSIIASARGKYRSPARWIEVARPLRDELRMRLRDALLGYVLATDSNLTERTVEELYGRYLIDPKMDPWLQVTRIKAATGALQTYVQRGFLGLEAGFTLNGEDAIQWEWMKNFRVWEAARKVFLYPENWLEPELRDQKTQFYAQFEKDLGQDRFTDEHLNQVFLKYLQRVDEVQRLYPVSIFEEVWEDESGTERRTTHILGRTRSTPHSYWYRTRSGDGTFSAWQEVSCGLEGSQIHLFAQNRRLFLFWIGVEEKKEGNHPPTMRFHVSFSEYEPERSEWTPKRDGRPSKYHFAEVQPDQLSLLVGPVEDAFQKVDDDPRSPGEIALEVAMTETVGRPESSPLLQRWVFNPRSGEIRRDARAFDWRNHVDYRKVENDGQGFVAEEARLVVHPYTYLLTWSPSLNAYEYNEDDAQEVHLWDKRYHGRVLWPRLISRWNYDSPFIVDSDYALHTTAIPSDMTQFLVERVRVSMSRLEELGLAIAGVSGPNESTVDPGFTIKGQEVTQDMLDAAGKTGAPIFGSQGDAPYRFHLMSHPWLGEFVETVRDAGIVGLLKPEEGNGLRRQQLSLDTFDSTFAPTEFVADPYPVADIDFTFDGSMSEYNWELFFHAPWLIARRLGAEQRFDQALRWIRMVFDPYTTDGSSWMVRPLAEESTQDPVSDWESFSGVDNAEALDRFVSQVNAWMDEPFNPHVLARLRPGTYKKAIFMDFLDILMGWGDQLFRRDTIESIQEASQLYLLAQALLGERPVALPESSSPTDMSYNDLVSSLDEFGNALVAIENTTGNYSGYRQPKGQAAPDLPLIPYFCIPENPQLLRYWDLVEDRLFKLRTGLNIEGVRRQLPLYQPPLDPGALVKGRALGADYATVLAELAKPLPKYRFTVLLQRAQSLAASVKGLGGALLSAYEKRDSEALSLLRSGHELGVMDVSIEMRGLSVSEARESLSGLRVSRASAIFRAEHYDDLKATGDLASETSQTTNIKIAGTLSAVAGGLRTASGILNMIPQFSVGNVLEAGGAQLHGLFQALAEGVGTAAGIARLASELNAIKATRDRRDQDWEFQRSLAEREVRQLDKQIAAGEIRVELAQRELRLLEQQKENALEVDDFMRSKFTNEDLYTWTVGQVSTLYFQAYQLAYDLAKQAETCYRHEMGDPSAQFIKFGHWDNLRKGLLSGDRLALDLDRMDTAYMAADIREREITKHISLDRLDPAQLLQLRLTGECTFELPEWLYDMDFPGHYLRRIKSVGLTIASVVGREQGVNAELTLLRHSRRDELDADFSAQDYRSVAVQGDVLNETVAISGALDDSGTFQVDFTGPRYMPFERRGAVSQWRLRLTGYPAQFDWMQIADVTMHVRYTARSLEIARESVKSAVDELLAGSTVPEGLSVPLPGTGLRAISLARDLPDTWYSASQDLSAGFTLTFVEEYLRYGHAAASVEITAVSAWVVGDDNLSSVQFALEAALNNEGPAGFDIVGTAPFEGGVATIELGTNIAVGEEMTIELTDGAGLTPEDVVFIFQYTVS